MLGHFGEHAAPELPSLRTQLIHNDVNPQNVVVDTSTKTRVAATACAYQITEVAGPLDAPLDLVRAYHAIHPLTEPDSASCTTSSWPA